ncbi:MAG: HD domain-containing protein [Treponema sp.]|jgi:poly(A) polymerase|nr:HD domain-containing protein [Treponema sp.]
MGHNKTPAAKTGNTPPVSGGPDLSPLQKIPGDFPVNLYGFSALDRYFGIPDLPFIYVETGADISVLARTFEDLRFPGPALADGAVNLQGGVCYFRCIDPEEPWRPSYTLLSFRQDIKTRRFRDPSGLYPLIRELRDGPPGKDGGRETGSGEPWWAGLYSGADSRRALMDGALVLARYGPADEEPSRLIREIAALFNRLPAGPPPGEEEQRLLLTGLLTSPRPGSGLELLKAAGFLRDFWPELADMDDVDHSKEFHPEGNVWKHTLETFRYRKPGPGFDLRLSLGLLLHDVGKTSAEPSGAHRFEGHAELGARQARRFLERLGFEAPLVEDIFYLVRNHMLPAALPRLPLTRTEEIMTSPLFPTLMELYRCDESSSFKGLDAYYESSAAYQAYLRYRRNPYRSADGRKLRDGVMR